MSRLHSVPSRSTKMSRLSLDDCSALKCGASRDEFYVNNVLAVCLSFAFIWRNTEGFLCKCFVFCVICISFLLGNTTVFCSGFLPTMHHSIHNKQLPFALSINRNKTTTFIKAYSFLKLLFWYKNIFSTKSLMMFSRGGFTVRIFDVDTKFFYRNSVKSRDTSQIVGI